MPGAARLGDISVGHSPKPLLGASAATVLINGRSAALLGDFHSIHRLGKHYHPYYVATGNCSVLVQGRPLATIGSTETCGVHIGTGSCNVIA